MAPSTLVTCKNMGLSVASQDLFAGLSFSVERGKLLALIGPNGCGKSSLLRRLFANQGGDANDDIDNGLLQSGELSIAPRIEIAYLPQEVYPRDSINKSGPPGKAGLEARLCRQFGLEGEFNPGAAYSDGERQKRAIIELLLAEADLYLFDEPTNYLDIAGITAFEDNVVELVERGKGVILVSHDRALIDNLADETILLTAHGIYRADGGASAVWAVYDFDFEARRSQAKDIEKKIAQLQADARNKAGWSSISERRKIGAGSSKPHLGKLSKKMARRAKVMQRRSEMEAEKLRATKPFVPKKVRAQFPEYEIRSLNVFSLREVAFTYSDSDGSEDIPEGNLLLRDVEFAADTSDKVCLMGPNGAGKSTIIRLILQQLRPTHGTAYLNESVRLAFVPQGLAGCFTKSRLLDNFVDVPVAQNVVRQFLGSVLLRGEKVNQPVASLSSGELMRAALVKCILGRAEFLILDEPTSHLDIESIVVLEQLLRDYRGGFLMISHDRAFVSNTARRLYLVEDGRLRLV